MIALDGNFAYSFITGVLATVNPCGFVLLPTYLLYFLGMESRVTDRSAAATAQRALVVGSALSAGFISVFFVVALISRIFTTWIQEHAKYAAFVIGILLMVAGIAMLLGWKPRFATPNLENKGRTFSAMFTYGIIYAITSIGCTIGMLTSAIFGSVNLHGYVSGVLSITLYGVGMSVTVIALTVTLAFAHTGMLKALRRGLPYIDRLAAVFLIGTGAYLTWYWYSAISERTGTDSVTSRIEGWQTDVADFLDRQGAGKLALVFGLIVLAAIGAMVFAKRRGVRSGSTAPTG